MDTVNKCFQHPEIKWKYYDLENANTLPNNTYSKCKREFISIDKICTNGNSERFKNFIHSLLKHDVQFSVIYMII